MQKIFILTVLLFAFSFSAYAERAVIDAKGQIFMKDEAGAIQGLDAVLTVPVSEPDKAFTVTVNGCTATTEKYWKVEEYGRTVLYLLFKKPPCEEGDSKKWVLMRGTVVKGTNMAFYQGDIFAKECAPGILEGVDEILLKLVKECPNLKYKASFYFVRECDGECPTLL